MAYESGTEGASVLRPPNALENALPPLTPEELAWAKGFLLRPRQVEAVLAAKSLEGAVGRIRRQCGGCGPCASRRDSESENVRDRGYWYDAHGEHIEFFVGGTSGEVGSETRTRGRRYTRLTWRGLAKEVRENHMQEVLF